MIYYIIINNLNVYRECCSCVVIAVDHDYTGLEEIEICLNVLEWELLMFIVWL